MNKVGMLHLNGAFCKSFEHHPDKSFLEEFVGRLVSSNQVIEIAIRAILKVELESRYTDSRLVSKGLSNGLALSIGPIRTSQVTIAKALHHEFTVASVGGLQSCEQVDAYLVFSGFGSDLSVAPNVDTIPLCESRHIFLHNHSIDDSVTSVETTPEMHYA